MLQATDLISIQEVRTKVEKAYAAFQKYRSFSQEQVDAIVERMAAAGRAHAQRLSDAGVAALKAANSKDLKALVTANGPLVESSEQCHKEFKTAMPTEGIVQAHAH